ncbi:4Fe-4S dicluster domain-containing protein, partial [bacterium]|nr:4Fe-4S dicluster domain-containing protein [bacterium]
RKKATKILLYLAASLVITHSFLAVFVGGDQLLSMIQMSPLHNPGPAIMILLSTLFITAEFGIFREQFCIIACPYGRLQSVLQDDRSTVVLYDSKRGEPRKSDRNSKAPSGDCINCYRCVQVCPTGVDIRRGLQLECIQCTACIDACDAVMEKQGLPKGLIRYDAIDTAAGKRNPFFKIRTVIYLSILSVFFAGLIYAVSHRQPLRVEVIRGTMPFQISEDHIVTNHFRLHVYNRKTETATFKIRILPETQGLSWVIPQPLLVDGGEQGIFDLFIRFPESEIPPLQIKIDATTHDDVFSVTSDPFRVVNPAEFGSSE